MTIKEQAIINLKDFKQILDNLKIVFWLDGGALLGAYRDGDFPPGDEDDIDLGCWFNYAIFKDEIIQKAKEIDFKLYHEWEWQIAMVRGGSKIDLFFHNKKGRDAWHCLYKQNKCIPGVVPSYFFEELDFIQFQGMVFARPRLVEEYFKLKYGENWQIPITREKYFKQGGCYDPNVNKILKPDYETN